MQFLRLCHLLSAVQYAIEAAVPYLAEVHGVPAVNLLKPYEIHCVFPRHGSPRLPIPWWVSGLQLGILVAPGIGLIVVKAEGVRSVHLTDAKTTIMQSR